MLYRWDTRVYDLNLFLTIVEKLCPSIVKSRGRGRPPKHTLKEYLTLICIKEENRDSLRRAETSHSFDICGERVDHSVIHYWEKKLDEVFPGLIRRIGKSLGKYLKPIFKIIDSTKFSTWKNETIEFHTQVVICNDTVFPQTLFFGSVSPKKATANTITPGKGIFMADKWYDDNKALGEMFKAGYEPLVKPIEERCSGFFRRKARKIYKFKFHLYKHRGRGESPYGSLTKSYGDRLNSILITTTKTRIGARVVNYLIKLYLRVQILKIF